MSHPLRIKRKSYFSRLPEGAVLVARPSRYGNPISIIPEKKGYRVSCAAIGGPTCAVSGLDRDECKRLCVELYREWLTTTKHGRAVLDFARAELRGKKLACYCNLDEPCHADVLAELVNEEERG